MQEGHSLGRAHHIRIRRTTQHQSRPCQARLTAQGRAAGGCKATPPLDQPLPPRTGPSPKTRDRPLLQGPKLGREQKARVQSPQKGRPEGTGLPRRSSRQDTSESCQVGSSFGCSRGFRRSKWCRSRPVEGFVEESNVFAPTNPGRVSNECQQYVAQFAVAEAQCLAQTSQQQLDAVQPNSKHCGGEHRHSSGTRGSTHQSWQTFVGKFNNSLSNRRPLQAEWSWREPSRHFDLEFGGGRRCEAKMSLVLNEFRFVGNQDWGGFTLWARWWFMMLSACRGQNRFSVLFHEVQPAVPNVSQGSDIESVIDFF